MPTVVKTLKKMVPVRPTFISLVDRAASRMPFRVIKSEQENPMSLDISTLGARLLARKSDAPATPAAPVLVAIVTHKHEGDVLESVKKGFADAGLSVDKIEESGDGTLIFRQTEDPLDDCQAIRLSDEVVAVMKGFSPWKDGVMSSPFQEAVMAKGFYSNLTTATDLARDLVYAKLNESTSSADAAKKVLDIYTELADYAVSLAQGLPEVAFKADTVIATTKAEIAKKAEEKDEKKEEAPKGDGQESAPSGDNGETPKDGGKDEGEKAKKSDEPGSPPPAESPNGQLLEVIAQLSEAVKGLTEQVAEVKKSQDEASKRVDEIARKAETAAQAVSSAVVQGAVAGDDLPAAKTTKSEDPFSGCFDTGFIRRR